jgi:RNA polymerase sigma-70 factor, ECF subfamily
LPRALSAVMPACIIKDFRVTWYSAVFLSRYGLQDNSAPSLEELMQRARQGDQAAYTALFHAITPALRGFLIRRLGAHADVEDVIQNILLSIHRAGHTYDSARPFKVWMFAIARHRLNDHLRGIYRKGTIPDISLDDLTHELSSADVTGEQERREYLNTLLSVLPARQRKIVTMMKVEGHTAEDTAKALNMSVSAVKVAAHRAYKVLAQKAEALQEEERHGHG